MPVFRHPLGKRFLFIHIPRTAGRFIGTNLFENGCKCENGQAHDLWELKNRVELSHYHREYYEKYLDVEDIPHFAVVRNPIDRFISGMSYHFESSVTVDKKLLNFIINGYGAVQYYHHFRPQVEFISPKTHIWKYEDGMGKEFVSWLSELLGFDFVFKDNAELEYYKPDRRERISKTPHLIEMVREFYKEDFDRFYSSSN